uniref:PARP-type domain-containing protein n=1 Tax=Hemiselmis andersenii TaxID=464988 RepID=A0A7S1DN32_HEMAN|mmetsp:Transcript_19495/g.46845  ORF Transcript_19495/g.46845 Transcript_19495/m.46845 type:complete len:436 (+) Transcript_19495:131-1438(+)
MTWCIEYSKSGRAKCRNCGQKIENGVVRCGKEEFSPMYGPVTGWNHPECLTWRSLSPQSMIGWRSIRPEDQTAILNLVSGGAGRQSGGPTRWVPLPRPGQPWVPPPLSSAAMAGAGSSSSQESQHDGVMAEPNWATVEEERQDTDVLYGKVNVLVVGCRYYGGLLHEGEYAELVREPRNQYDRNAIRVDNMMAQQVGHIKKEQAAVLAPMIDDASPLKPWIEVEVNEGGTNMFQVSCTASIYGPVEYQEQVLRYVMASGVLRLKGNQSIPGSPGMGSGTGVTGTNSSNLSVVRSVKISSAEASQKSLDKLYDELKTDLSQLDTASVMKALQGKLLSPLFPHQQQGVAWMLSREASLSLPPFWSQVTEAGTTVYYNQVTKSSQSTAPAPVKGGLVCDDMGLGKTLQTLCCAAADQFTQAPGGGGGGRPLLCAQTVS